jgi:hypothetical protein
MPYRPTLSIVLLVLIISFCQCRKKSGPPPIFDYYFKVEVEDLSVDMRYAYTVDSDTIEFKGRELPAVWVKFVDVYEQNTDIQHYVNFQVVLPVTASGTGTFTPSQLYLQAELTPRKYLYSFQSNSNLTLTVTKILQGTADQPGVLEAHFDGTIVKRNPETQEDIAVVPITGSLAAPLTGL